MKCHLLTSVDTEAHFSFEDDDDVDAVCVVEPVIVAFAELSS